MSGHIICGTIYNKIILNTQNYITKWHGVLIPVHKYAYLFLILLQLLIVTRLVM